MKYFILVFATLFLSTAFGLNLPPTAKEASYFYYKSKIINPGFENGTSNWTASGGSFTVTTTAADLAEGARSAVFDASASGQTLSSSNYTIERGLRQNNGYAKCRVRTDATDYILDVYDGTNVIASQTIAATTEFSEQGINFVFPTSGTARLRIRSQSNASAVYVDDCYLGAAPNIQSAQRSQFVGMSYFAQTSSCIWSRTNTAIGAFGTVSACPGPTVGVSKIGSWQTTDSDLPRQTINNLPEGLYSVEVTGSLYGGGDWTMAVSDGTTTSPAYCSGSGNGAGTFQPATTCIAWFEYSGEGNRSFEIYGSSSSGAISLDNNQNNDRTTFTVKRWDRFPSTFASINNTDYGWTAYTATISNFGTVSSQDCWHSRVQADLLIRCKFTTSTGGAAAEARVSLPSSLTSLSTISTLEHAGSLLMNATSVGVLAALIEPSQTYITFSRDSATSNLAKINGNTLAASGFTYTLSARVPIQGWTANQSVPVFVGSVTSNSTAAERIERAFVTASTATVSRNSSSWLTVSRSGAGVYTLNFAAGTFSAPPTCAVTLEDTAMGFWRFSNTMTATSVNFNTSNTTDTVSVDRNFNIICMGPR